MNIPYVELNDGNTMPQLGLGVWQTEDGDEVIDAIGAALEHEYRLVDTAAMYKNEEGVGKAIAAASVPRSELFVTTKLWNSHQGYDETLKAFGTSLAKLGLEYVDLYLIHWPAPEIDRYVDSYKALEMLQKTGKVKSIGVCNFNIEHLEKLMTQTSIVPAVNQIELHPRLQQRELREFCKTHGIQVESWSPIGGSGGDLLEDPTLQIIADKHKRSAAQIVLRWHIQLGLVVIPKSVHADRIKQNAEIFDFELDNDDMAKISALDTGQRQGPDPATFNVA